MNAVHANCPNCGAALMLEGNRRITTCGFCNARLLVEIEGFKPRYWFEPAVSREQAVLDVLRALHDPYMPKDTARRANLESLTLAFIPFYRFRARRVGLIESREPEVDPATGETVGVRRDSRVVFNALSLFGLAADVPGWGIEHLDMDKVIEDERYVFRAFNAVEIQRLGEVFEATRPADRFLNDKMRLAETKNVEVKVAVHPEELSIYYYPVWLARYTYKGMAYRAGVDALTGEVLLARAPQTNRHRLPLMLFILALLSFPASRLVNHILESRDPAGVVSAIGYLVMIAWPATFTVLSAVLLILYMTWMNYRYAGEVVVTPHATSIEKLGKPSSTWVERLFERIDAVQQWIVDLRRRTQ